MNVGFPNGTLTKEQVATLRLLAHRKQFKRVSNKIADMVFDTWLIECSTSLTNHLLDRGDRPAVISALMKQQTTDRARNVINHGMDIHGGTGICLGYENFLTVEGLFLVKD